MSVEPLRDDLMVQQQLPATDVKQRAWQHMVAVIMLNRTNRVTVKRVLPVFLHYWPGPYDYIRASDSDVFRVIESLGMQREKHRRMVRMTLDFFKWDGNDATQLYAIGKYGSDSYEIFFKQNYSVEPGDKELRRYLQSLERSVPTSESLESQSSLEVAS